MTKVRFLFVSQHHLKYLLRPEHYFVESHFQLELERLFRPAWQFVATRSELSLSGDFVTVDLFGHPLLIRNCEGQHVAFQNVCSHRHCQLTGAAQGHSPTLRCQYHGWEYDRTGKTARIPDAKCFRPWDREHAHLVTYRLEACGDLLFVALTDEPPALREWLAPCFQEIERDFSSPEWNMFWSWEYEVACNWKIPAENTLESYHVPALHRKTFGAFYPSEEKSLHTLTPRYTELNYLSDTRMEAWQSRLRQWLGGIPMKLHKHRHFHPNTIFVTTDTFNYVLMYVPLSARSVRVRIRAFRIRGSRRDPFSQLAVWIAGRLGKRLTRKILNEDLGIYVSQQRGLEASRQQGVLGTREERIFAFQEYVLNAMGQPLPVSSEITEQAIVS